MSEEEIHQWLVSCFGPYEGEKTWSNFQNLPDDVREEVLARCSDGGLPSPEEVHLLMGAFTKGGLNTPSEMSETLKRGPINKRLAQLLARQKATGDGGTVNAQIADAARRALSQANLWLDTNCNLDPAPGTPDILSREDWVYGTIDSWIKFANPVAKSLSDAFSNVLTEKFGPCDDIEVSGLYDGVMPIPIPEGAGNPGQLISLLANTSFAMQLGYAAGELSHEVHGSFDQGIALLKNPAGALIPYNCVDYAQKWGIDVSEVMNYVALRELAHARLFASVPWLMPRFEALIIKYANGISIDLSAIEDQLSDFSGMDPDSISNAVDLSRVAQTDTDNQKQALKSLETLLALSEGWVDCVIWRAGMAHIPHINQLREMVRRERASYGPSEITFESLAGLKLNPRRIREAAELWDSITNEKGIEAREAMWNHPDLLPELPDFEEDEEDKANNTDNTTSETSEDVAGDSAAAGDASTAGYASENANNSESNDSIETTISETAKTDDNTSVDAGEASETSENTAKTEDESAENNHPIETNLNNNNPKDANTTANLKDANPKDLSKNMLNLDDFKNSDHLEQKLKDINWDDELSKLLASSDAYDDNSDSDSSTDKSNYENTGGNTSGSADGNVSDSNNDSDTNK